MLKILNRFENIEKQLEDYKEQASKNKTSLLLIAINCDELLEEAKFLKTALSQVEAPEKLTKKANFVIKQITDFMEDLSQIRKLEHGQISTF